MHIVIVKCIKNVYLYQNIECINDRLEPDIMCYINVLKACTEITSYHLGQIHQRIMQNSSIFIDPLIQSSLINFYGKCKIGIVSTVI